MVEYLKNSPRDPNQSSWKPGATTTSNNVASTGPSSEPLLDESAKQGGCCTTSNAQLMELQLLTSRRNDQKQATANFDMEVLAHKRGIAMLRYKEKRKTRRQSLLIFLCAYIELDSAVILLFGHLIYCLTHIY